MALPKKPRILVVDDEKTIRRFLKAALAASGYDVFEAADGREALKEAVAAHPDAIILDLGLPDIEGVEVARLIRKRSKVPIVILSVREDVSDKIAALDAGADDYLTKPFDAREMLARLRAVMRRLVPKGEEAVFKSGKLTVDLARRKIEVAGRPVNVTPTEYDVLRTLVLNAGRVLTHRQFLQEVWDKPDDMAGGFHLVRVTVKNLRDKIEPNPDRPVYILTEPGVGYRFHTDD